MPLKSATFKKPKLRAHKPGDPMERQERFGRLDQELVKNLSQNFQSRWC
jgi:hypothetical protein